MNVKTLCLGILTLGEASGYDIKKVFEDSFSHFYAAGFGSIYPALAELAREGLVTCSDVEQEKRPAKKVYRITAGGMQHFREALAETYPSHRVRSELMVLMVFAGLLGAERMEQVLDLRLEDVDVQLALIDRCVEGREPSAPGIAFAAGFARTVLAAGRDYIQQHRAELIQALRQQSPSENVEKLP